MLIEYIYRYNMLQLQNSNQNGCHNILQGGSFRFNHMCLLFTILSVADSSGKFKMTYKMAINNNNGPLN